MTQTPPVWAGKAVVSALWVATNETPEWVVARLDGVLQALAAAFGTAYWETSSGARWEGSAQEKAAIVQSFGATDPFGDPEPGSGFTFTVSGAGERVGLHVRVAAGSDTLGRRTPLHTVVIELRNMVEGAVDAAAGDAVVHAVVEHWQPASVTLADAELLRTARRGGWRIGFGYRVWISTAVGSVAEVAPGLTTAPFADGTLISAPDDWPAADVIAALGSTFASNGLDEIPR